jgi:hypothetical protein
VTWDARKAKTSNLSWYLGDLPHLNRARPWSIRVLPGPGVRITLRHLDSSSLLRVGCHVSISMQSLRLRVTASSGASIYIRLNPKFLHRGWSAYLFSRHVYPQVFPGYNITFTFNSTGVTRLPSCPLFRAHSVVIREGRANRLRGCQSCGELTWCPSPTDLSEFVSGVWQTSSADTRVTIANPPCPRDYLPIDFLPSCKMDQA